MTKEQEARIKLLKDFTKMDFSNPMGWTGYYDTELKELSEAIETVLSMLKERDEKIEYYKKQKNYDDQFKHELLEQIRCLNLDKDEKDRQIDLMAEFMFKNIDIEEDICNSAYVECKQETSQDITCINCIKQYFERKAEQC